MQGLLTTLLLPPLLLLLIGIGAGVLAWRGRRMAGAVAALACLGVLLLATPYVSGHLMASLEPGPDAGASGPAPEAIVILGGDVARDAAGRVDVGPLTLERLRAGAVLHRRTGLPVLVTGGPLGPRDPALGVLMRQVLAEDFGVTTRWVEAAARDTRDNAALSAAMLRQAGIGAAHVVSHGWHLWRAREAFGRHGFPVVEAPVRRGRLPEGQPRDWVPRADYLGSSWFALREWAGRLVYALRDAGPAPRFSVR